MNTMYIYTFGQIETLRAILAAISAIFDPTNSEFFATSDGFGGGVGVTMAAIIGMMGIFSNYFRGNKVLAHGPVVSLVLYGALTVPKVDNVFLIDNYTGAIEVVTDVPLGLAAVGHAMSTISKSVTETFETELSIPGSINSLNFDHGLIGGRGFLSPLKTMLMLRENIINYAPYHLTYNTKAYYHSCLMRTLKEHEEGTIPSTTAVFDAKTFKGSDPFAHFTTAVTQNYLVEYIDPTDNTMASANCNDLQAILTSDTTEGGIPFFLQDEDSFGRYALKTELSSSETNAENFQNGAISTAVNAITGIDETMTSLLQTENVNRKYMVVRFFQDFVKEINSDNISSPYVNASYAEAMVSNIENTRSLSAIEGETFLHYMLPTMGFITAIWYASWPLIMLVMVAKGTEATTFYGSYLGMALWIYSWQPIAAVINFVTISSVTQDIQAITANISLSMETEQMFFNRVADALTVGSNLLGATPLISLAMISGSIFALTGVAQSASTPTGGASAGAQSITPKLKNQGVIANAPSSYKATDPINAPGISATDKAYSTAESVERKSASVLQNQVGTSNKISQLTGASATGAVQGIQGTNLTTSYTNSQGQAVTGTVTANEVYTDSVNRAASQVLSGERLAAFQEASRGSVGLPAIVASYNKSVEDSQRLSTSEVSQIAQGTSQNWQGSDAIANATSITDGNNRSLDKQSLKRDVASTTDGWTKALNKEVAATQASSKATQSNSNVTKTAADVVDYTTRNANNGRGIGNLNEAENFITESAYNAAVDFGFSQPDATAYAGARLEQAKITANEFGSDKAPFDLLFGNQNSLASLPRSTPKDLSEQYTAIGQQQRGDLWSSYMLASAPHNPGMTGKVEAGIQGDLNKINGATSNPTQGQTMPSTFANAGTKLDAHAANIDNNPLNNTNPNAQWNKISANESQQIKQTGNAYAEQLQHYVGNYGYQSTPGGIDHVPTVSDALALKNQSPDQPRVALANLNADQGAAVRQGASLHDAFLSPQAKDGASQILHGKNYSELTSPNDRAALDLNQIKAMSDNAQVIAASSNKLSPQEQDTLNEQYQPTFDGINKAFDQANTQDTLRQQVGVANTGLVGASDALKAKNTDVGVSQEFDNNMNKEQQENRKEENAASTDVVSGNRHGVSGETAAKVNDIITNNDSPGRKHSSILNAFDDEIKAREDSSLAGQLWDGIWEDGAGNNSLTSVKNLEANRDRYQEIYDQNGGSAAGAYTQLLDEVGFAHEGSLDSIVGGVAASLTAKPLLDAYRDNSAQSAKELTSRANHAYDKYSAQAKQLRTNPPPETVRNPGYQPHQHANDTLENGKDAIRADVDKNNSYPRNLTHTNQQLDFDAPKLGLSNAAKTGSGVASKIAAPIAAAVIIGTGVYETFQNKDEAQSQSNIALKTAFAGGYENASQRLEQSGYSPEQQANLRADVFSAATASHFANPQIINDRFKGDKDEAQFQSQQIIQQFKENGSNISADDLGAVLTSYVEHTPGQADELIGVYNDQVKQNFGDGNANPNVKF